MNKLPVLYSFRRCPYAIRARLALATAHTPVELREVVLKNKPAAMLEASPKGTVPVLVPPGGPVIDESLDIMRWALDQHDPEEWRRSEHPHQQQEIAQLIRRNDVEFKPLLDRYKYADRYPEHPASTYRRQAEAFLQLLEERLQRHSFLLDDRISLADRAILPFIRQFAQVDRPWFDQADYPKLQQWLQTQLDSRCFQAVMAKYNPWQPSASPVVFPTWCTVSS